MQSLNMTLHALLAHLEELSRLKNYILYQRPAADSVACSTRSANDLSSPLPLANSTSATPGSTHGLRNNVVTIFIAIHGQISIASKMEFKFH
jgi:hypothetical protein